MVVTRVHLYDVSQKGSSSSRSSRLKAQSNAADDDDDGDHGWGALEELHIVDASCPWQDQSREALLDQNEENRKIRK